MIKHLLLCFLLLASFCPMHAQNSLLDDARQKFSNAANYTLEVARLMPAEHYTYKPTPDQETFQEQLIHILSNATWLSGGYLTDQPFKINWKEKEGLSKEETLVLLETTFAQIAERLETVTLESLEEEVDFFTPQVRNKGQILTLLNDHHTHHRGELVVYLRLQNIKPPRYQGW
ncbi:MAG: DinB family protein [Bacteroidota bacterium]